MHFNNSCVYIMKWGVDYAILNETDEILRQNYDHSDFKKNVSGLKKGTVGGQKSRKGALSYSRDLLCLNSNQKFIHFKL